MPTFELCKKPPQVPDRARIFRLAPPRVNRASVLAAARRFGLSGQMKTGALCQDAHQTTYSEGSLEVVVHHASGGIRFHDTALWQVDDGVSHVAFDDATAIGMAQRFMEAHAFLPGDSQMLRVARLNVNVAEVRTGFAQHRFIDVAIALARVVDGAPVEGPGGKAIVYLDAKGGLTGLHRLWRDTLDDEVQEVPLRSPEEVQQEAIREWDRGGSGRVTVDDIRFAYLEHGWDVSQRFLQPAYVVSTTIHATEGHSAGRAVMRSEYWGAAAAAKPPERLVPRLRDPPVQARYPQ